MSRQLRAKAKTSSTSAAGACFTPVRSGVLQRKRSFDKAAGLAERDDERGEHSDLQRRATNQAEPATVPPIVHEVLRSSGQPLDVTTRAFMEPRFGHDFNHVRVHTDARAARAARAVNALAYTVGNDIAFGKGQYAPDNTEGKRILAHELTHVLQQKTHQNSMQTKLSIGKPANAAERQADDVADAVVLGIGKVPNSFAPAMPSIQRVCGVADIGTRTECDDQDPIFVTGHPFFKFNASCDDFAPGEEANLSSTAATLPASGPVEVHGYASVDGDATFNENLSCARALKARTVLTSAGITAGRISVVKHGPTPGPTADRRSVVISSPAAPGPTPTPTPTPAPPITPLTVAFTRVQASTSPAGMSDRIPPRVDTTVGVGIVGHSIPMRPVTLSIDGAGGGNGTATINGAATVDLSSSAAMRLRGVDQTAVGNAGNLTLVADIGGTRLATSNSFSVSAIPQNWNVSFSSIVAGPLPGRAGLWRGFIVRDRWDSDSRPRTHNTSDLDQTEISEEVQSNPGSGVFAGVAVSTSGFLPGNVFSTDTHASPVSLLTGNGNIVLNQTSKFHDHRSSSTNIPMTNAGYLITHSAMRIPLVGTVFVTHFKRGAATTANSVFSTAGTGSVTRTQRV